MIFDGKVGFSRKVAQSGRKRDQNAKDLVKEAKKQRELRAVDRQRASASIKIQNFVRCRTKVGHFRDKLRSEYDVKVASIDSAMYSPPADAILGLAVLVIWSYHGSEDDGRLHTLQRMFIKSLSMENPKDNVLLYTTGNTVKSSSGDHSDVDNKFVTVRQVAAVLRLTIAQMLAWALTQQRGQQEKETVSTESPCFIAAHRFLNSFATSRSRESISESDDALSTATRREGLNAVENTRVQLAQLVAPQCSSALQALVSTGAALVGEGERFSGSWSSGSEREGTLISTLFLELISQCLMCAISRLDNSPTQLNGLSSSQQLQQSMLLQIALAVLSIPHVTDIPATRPLLSKLQDDADLRRTLWASILPEKDTTDYFLLTLPNLPSQASQASTKLLNVGVDHRANILGNFSSLFLVSSSSSASSGSTVLDGGIESDSSSIAISWVKAIGRLLQDISTSRTISEGGEQRQDCIPLAALLWHYQYRVRPLSPELRNPDKIYVQEHPDASRFWEFLEGPYLPVEMDALEHGYQLANGVKKLEYRVSSIHKELRLHAQRFGNPLRKKLSPCMIWRIFNTVLAKNFVPKVLDIVSSTEPAGQRCDDAQSEATEGVKMVTNVSESSYSQHLDRERTTSGHVLPKAHILTVFQVVNCYASLLMSTPLGLDDEEAFSHISDNDKSSSASAEAVLSEEDIAEEGGEAMEVVNDVATRTGSRASAASHTATTTTSRAIPSSSSSSVGTDKSPVSYELLNIIAFSRPGNHFVKRLWEFLMTFFGFDLVRDILLRGVFVPVGKDGAGTGITGAASTILGGGLGASNSGRYSPEIRETAKQLGADEASICNYLCGSMFLFCSVFSHQLNAVDDDELLEKCSILPLSEIKRVCELLRDWLQKLFLDSPVFDVSTSFLQVPPSLLALSASTSTSSSFSSSSSSSAATPSLAQANTTLMLHQSQLAATRLFNQLCARNDRRKFLPLEDLQWSNIPFNFDMTVAEDSEASGVRDARGSGVGGGGVAGAEVGGAGVEEVEGAFAFRNPTVKAVLTFIPQVVPFNRRVALFQSLLERDKERFHSSLGMGFHVLHMTRINVRRDRIIKDAYSALNGIGNKLKGRVQVQFISDQGTMEAGIDGGGLFKEFLDSFSKAAFDPEYGLFKPTSGQLLTPDPAWGALDGGGLNLYNFIGKMLGKAVYERILLESDFAGGFLNVLLGRTNQLDDLYHLDAQLYRSLMQIKHLANAGGDIESMELFFDVSRDQFGQVVTKELIPGGSSIRVTRANVHSYIHLLAHYKQNLEIAAPCRAFLSGFRQMIPLEWVRMFNTRELQKMISGERKAIDLADFKRHVSYQSGYLESQPYVQAFWRIVGEMSPEDQGNLLKFVTSCSRPPILGFSQLNPPFGIQKVVLSRAASGDDQMHSARLPSASTCFNLLKLPEYESDAVLKEKLLYAIRAKSGFELS